jgi:general L-amino acid transport system permease protein
MPGSPWKARPARAFLWQVLAIAAVALIVLYLVSNTLDNLANRGIASGFGFMSSTAGFGIASSLIEYDEASSIGRAFLVGILNTLLVSAVGIVIATIAGVVTGIARLSPNWLLSRLAGGYVETLRNIPLLLQIFFWYFVVLRALPVPRNSYALGDFAFLNNRGLYVPSADNGNVLWLWLCLAMLMIGLQLWRRQTLGKTVMRRLWGGLAALLPVAMLIADWSSPTLRGFNFTGGIVLTPELVALATALATYTAAFIAEIVRAGIQAVPKGQVEAARALGLGSADVMRRVVLPQALRVIVPPLTNQYLNLTKNSSLAAAIAYPDLVSVFAGTALSITGQAVEMITLVMAVYLSISLVIALVMNFYNRSVGLRGT